MGAAANAERRWVTPSGALIILAHGTYTTGNRDGWRLIVKHPGSGVVISSTHLGATVPETELAAAIAAVGAIPVITPTRTIRRSHP